MENVQAAKKISDIIGKITVDGQEISFAEYLENMGGSGALYDDGIGQLLDRAALPGTEWVDVVDYIGPIANEILCEAVQVDQATYVELVGAIKHAWNRLRMHAEADKEFVINKETPDVMYVVEDLIHHLSNGWEIRCADFHAAGDMQIVIGKPLDAQKG